MTTKGRQAPYRVPITHDGKKGLVLLDQIRTIDKGRLVKRLGAVSNKTLGASLNILQGAFTLQWAYSHATFYVSDCELSSIANTRIPVLQDFPRNWLI